jgi:hypothetical protein
MEKTYTQFIVKDYILKITGIFNYDKKFLKKAVQSGYENLEFTSAELNFNKDYFYPDLRKQFFSNDKERHPILIKHFDGTDDIELYAKNHDGTQITKRINFGIKDIRLDLFDDCFGLFTINLKILANEIDLCLFSDASFLARNFETLVKHSAYTYWHEFIEKEVLLGYTTRGQSIKTDEYSGTKYKLFMVLDVPELEDKEMTKQLLFDIATLSRIGSAIGTSPDSMDKGYINQLIKNNSITIYNNWDGLALLDTFTVVGNKILDLEYKKVTYSSVYHGIYLYCLFIKYSLFKLNFEIADLDEDRREYFQDFLSKYYFSYISYNFLPTEIFNKIRNALDIEKELKLLKEKIVEIGLQIQEEQQDKTNKILGVVTVLSSLSSVQPVYDYLLIGQKWLGWNSIFYWTASVSLALVIGLGIGFYIFGNTVIKWFKKKK